MLNPSCPPHDRQIGICIFDDIVEYGGTESIKYFEQFVPAIMQYTQDPHPGVRQAAVYGVGICAQVGRDHFKHLVADALNRLGFVINDQNARSEDNIHATENAISAVGRICRYQTTAIDISLILPMWLSYLPVTQDKVESRVVYDNLCFFLENSSFTTYILGSNHQNLPKILGIFGDILGSPLIDEAISARVVTILKVMQTSYPSPLLQQAFGALTDQQRNSLRQSVV